MWESAGSNWGAGSALPSDPPVCWQCLLRHKKENVPASLLLELGQGLESRKYLGSVLVTAPPSACNLGNSGTSKEVNSLQTWDD